MRKPEPPRQPERRPEPAARPKPAAPDGGGSPWLWGRHAVLAALANPERKLLRILATADTAAAIATGGADGPAPQLVSREEMQRILPAGAVHQGVAVLARPLKPATIDGIIDQAGRDERALVVALDQVTDPHNVGAILRSAAAFGALAVLVPERNAPEISGTLAKSASGAVEHVRLVRAINLVRALEQLKKAGFWVVGLDGAAGQTLASHRLAGKVVLVLGAEGNGMRRLTREACDLMARLPTAGPVASLNVSNAAAIALYELSRDG